jgi:hypothetical protein
LPDQRNIRGDGASQSLYLLALQQFRAAHVFAAAVAGPGPDSADLRVFKRNPSNLSQSIISIEQRTRGYGTYSKCSQYGL